MKAVMDIKMTVEQSVKKKNIRVSLGVIFCMMMSLFLSACSGKADHPPRKGEYGETKLESVFVDSSKVELLNSDAFPKPFFEQMYAEMVNIPFEADSSKNPYRFVIVVRGKAQTAGEVDVQFLGGVMSMSSNELSPAVIREEDSHKYKANESVMLILPSDPFSINVNAAETNYLAQAALTQRDNLIIDDIELQVWHGKGSKYPLMYYLSFFSIIAIVLLVVYRFVSGLQAR